MNRREWLFKSFLYGTIGAALATFGGILLDVWLAAGKFTMSHWTEIGPVELFRAARVAPFLEKRAALILREDRVAAISLDCTHLGCLLNVTGEGFFCPCHGSRFGPLGEVYSGPAKESLRWHDIRLRQGSIWIRAGEKVSQPRWISSSEIAAHGKHH
ncbi:MAG: Rieske 2Fe-2S domain-containing protein [Desulfatiglandales bacterium]|jgi:cytochrome b6-f complex iron-sulfur subunit